MNKNVHNNKAMKGNYRSRMYRKIKRWRIFFFQQSCVYGSCLSLQRAKILVFSLKHCTEQHNILA